MAKIVTLGVLLIGWTGCSSEGDQATVDATAVIADARVGGDGGPVDTAVQSDQSTADDLGAVDLAIDAMPPADAALPPSKLQLTISEASAWRSTFGGTSVYAVNAFSLKNPTQSDETVSFKNAVFLNAQGGEIGKLNISVQSPGGFNGLIAAGQDLAFRLRTGFVSGSAPGCNAQVRVRLLVISSSGQLEYKTGLLRVTCVS